MKKSILFLSALAAFVFTSCKETPYINEPGDSSYDYDSIPVLPKPEPTPDPEGIVIPDGCLNVYQAINLCKKLKDGETTTEKYYIKGWVFNLDAKNADGINSYGNATFYMAATNDGESNAYSFEAYQVYGKDGKKLTSENQVEIGDFVIIYGPLTYYKSQPETAGKGEAYIYASTNENWDVKEDHTKLTPDAEGVDVPQGTLNVYEARAISDSIGSGKTTTDKYYIKGWVCKLDAKNTDGINSYGNATFYIAPTNDGTTNAFTFEAYQVYGKDGKKFVDVNQVQVGDFVVIYGQITNFNGTAETVGKGAAYVYSSSNVNFDPVVDDNKLTPDPDGVVIPEGTLNVYEARAVSDSIGSGKTTTEEYYIKGWISKLDSKNESGITSYGNATFYIAPTNDGTTNGTTFEAYQVYGLNKQKLTNVNQVAVGDFVIIRGKITNYNGTAETTGKGSSYIYYSTNPNLQPNVN